jgi:hypothetical protein
MKENCNMKTPDDYIVVELQRLAATLPLGGVARGVWGGASDPAMHADVIADSRDELVAYVSAELRKRRISVDALVLPALADIVASAMVQQHVFTETITNRSCLAPFVEPAA